MSEIFSIVCQNVTVSAAQDVLCAYAASTKKLILLGVELAANGQTTVGNYPISVKYLPATVTAGSGGGVTTPHNANPAGAAASFAARMNDTTMATSSGTVIPVLASQFNPINGYYWQPPSHELEIISALSGAISLHLDAAPAGTIYLSATMWVKEI